MRVVFDELQQVGAAEGPTIEETLEAFQDEAAKGTDPQRWIHMGAIRFYLRRAIWMCRDWTSASHGVSNYTRLVGQVRRWADLSQPQEKVTFITFNYDTLLDDACYELGIYPDDLDSYVSNDRYALAKFHGSVNCVDPITNGAEVFRNNVPPIRNIIRQFAQVRTSGVLEVTTPREVAVTELDRTSALPGLAVPFLTKAGPYCPPLQLQRLDDALANCDRLLLVIGWRGAEDHFWQRIKSRSKEARVHVVASATGLEERLARGLEEFVRVPRDHVTLSAAGFSEFMQSEDLHKFLGG